MAEFIDRLRSLLAGRYGIERELGRGGMATVYLAEDLKHRRPVAIKLLDSELAALLGPERFVREIEIAAHLQHPHILPLLDSGADGTLFYFVMPFVAGESLRQRLITERQLSQDEAVRLTIDVAQALDYANRNGIVHRDIKPENILLVDGQAVVADFGIARAIRASGGEKLTKTGVTLGSPPYMSPEQITGSADVDGRSDIYSLGCVLYEMLAGQAPFSGPPETLSHQHLNLTPRPIRELRPTVTPELEAVLTRALAKTPADRFASGAEFAAALASAIRSAPPTTPGARPAAEPVPRGAPAMRIALISLAVLAAVAAALLVWRYQARVRTLAAAGGANRRWVWLADFDGPAGDPSLAPAAHDLVGASLDQSKVFASVPVEQVKIALRNSGRPDTTRIGADLARELAFRSSIPVVVDGRIGKIGSSYSIALRATNAEDGRVIESATGAASTERDLIPVLTRLARQLREALGERGDAFRSTASWNDAPTPSFEAFKLYLLGRKLLNQGNSWAALPLLRQAVALDPDFATAWTTLGTAFGNVAQGDSAIAALREALRHPDRLSAVGRLDVQGKIALHDGDANRIIEAYDAILNLNPSPVERSAALNNKAEALAERGQSEQALELYRKAAAVMPIAPTPLVLGNIVDQLIGLHRLSEAREMLPVLRGPSASFSELELDLADRSWDRAESVATAMQHDAAAPPLAHLIAGISRASVRGARGDIGGALRGLDEIESAAGPNSAPVGAALWFNRLSIALALGKSPPPVPIPIRKDTWGIAAFATLAAENGDSIAARRAVASWPESVETASRRALNDQVEARLDARKGHWDREITRLRTNALGGVRSIPTMERILRTPSRWLMADAFTKLGQPDSAAAYLNLLLEPTAFEPPSLETRGLIEPFVRCRLVRLYAQMGRLNDARHEWEIVSATCTKPDPEVLAILDDTRAVMRTTRAMGAGK